LRETIYFSYHADFKQGINRCLAQLAVADREEDTKWHQQFNTKVMIKHITTINHSPLGASCAVNRVPADMKV